MPLVVGHECAEVGVGVANVDGGRIAALDVDRWGSGGSGNDGRGWCAYLNLSLLLKREQSYAGSSPAASTTPSARGEVCPNLLHSIG